MNLHHVPCGMPRPLLQVQKIGKHDADIAAVEGLRHTMPVNLYLGVLHVAATTGHLQEYDEKGVLTGVRQVTANQQLDAAKYLVDKIMPNRAPIRIEAAPELSLEQAVENPQELTYDQLQRLANGTADTDVKIVDVFSIPTNPS